MKSYKIVMGALLALIVIVIQSCKTTQTQSIEVSEMDGKWILKTIEDQDAAVLFPRKKPDVEFNLQEKRVSGFAGCNRYFGAFTLSNNIFSAPNLAGTMMACPELDNERNFNRLLSQPSELQVRDGNLLFIQNGKVVLVFERQQPLTASDFAGEWKLQSLQGATANVYFKSRIPFLTFDFDQNRVSGNAGCNNFFGSFNQTGSHEIEIGLLGTTRMMCQDAMEGENKFVNALPGKSAVEIIGNQMILTRDGIHVATFSKE